jgi:hypothetical protein
VGHHSALHGDLPPLRPAVDVAVHRGAGLHGGRGRGRELLLVPGGPLARAPLPHHDRPEADALLLFGLDRVRLAHRRHRAGETERLAGEGTGQQKRDAVQVVYFGEVGRFFREVGRFFQEVGHSFQEMGRFFRGDKRNLKE